MFLGNRSNHASSFPCTKVGIQREDFANAIAHVVLNPCVHSTIWARPFELDITSAIKPQGNRLEITVVNHWANRVIGDAKLPAAERRTKTNIKRLTADTPLVESGLTGPVELWIEE